MSGIGFLDEAMEQVEAGVKQVKQIPSDMAKSTQAQVTVAIKGNGDTGTSEAGQHAQDSAQSQQSTKDFVNDLYAPSKHGQGQSEGKAPSKFVQELMKDGKSPDEAMQLESLRKKLHDETYYIPLTQRKSIDQEHQEEEQKEEQEKMQELQSEEEKKKKEQPISVQMGSNRAEQFPGASG